LITVQTKDRKDFWAKIILTCPECHKTIDLVKGSKVEELATGREQVEDIEMIDNLERKEDGYSWRPSTE